MIEIWIIASIIVAIILWEIWYERREHKRLLWVKFDLARLEWDNENNEKEYHE